LPKDFITWLEILLGGESDLLMCNGDSGYNYGEYFEDALLKAFGGDQEDVDKVTALCCMLHVVVRGTFALDTDATECDCL